MSARTAEMFTRLAFSATYNCARVVPIEVDIAEQLFISEETVKVHVKHIMEKLGATDRTPAVAIAARRGFIQL